MKILMVCLGNICRSPIAEGLLREKAAQRGLEWKVASAGTERFHVGQGAHKQSVKVCQENGLDISNHIARRLTPKDFETYDILYALATDVYQEMKYIAPSAEAMKKVKLIMDEAYPGQKRSVKDPYYGGYEDYVDVYNLLNTLSDTILDKYATH